MQIIAHRGDSTRAHENTLAAFEAAYNTGAYGVEFDVRLSADDVPIIFHNMMIGENFISDLTCAELQAIPLDPMSDNRIPMLTQVLDEFAGKMYLEMHLQSDRYDLVHGICKLIRQYPQLHDMFEVTSFEPAIIQAILIEDASIPCDLLFHRDSWMTNEMALRLLIDKAKLAQPRGVHLFPDQITVETVERFRSLGLDVHCGVLNDMARYPQIEAAGISQMVTDDIHLFI